MIAVIPAAVKAFAALIWFVKIALVTTGAAAKPALQIIIIRLKIVFSIVFVVIQARHRAAAELFISAFVRPAKISTVDANLVFIWNLVVKHKLPPYLKEKGRANALPVKSGSI